jgi:hypothetical protein
VTVEPPDRREIRDMIVKAAMLDRDDAEAATREIVGRFGADALDILFELEREFTSNGNRAQRRQRKRRR